jgi:hypothetical protein
MNYASVKFVILKQFRDYRNYLLNPPLNRTVMKRMIMSIVGIVVFSLFHVNGQNTAGTDAIKTDKQYEIILTDGSAFTGTILSRDSATVVFQTNSIARMDIPVRQMKSLKEIQPPIPGKRTFKLANPFPTKYFFTQSAINLQKGEGYYQNTYVFLNSVSYGFTDYFSIGAGVEILSTIGSISSNVFSPTWYIAPKVGFKVSDQLYLGGGVTFANIGGFFDNAKIGIGYGLATFGSTEHNLSIGLTNVFSIDDQGNNTLITLAGMTRISERLALVTENYISASNDVGSSIFSYGLRFIASKTSVDLGFINNKDIIKSFFLGVPYVDFNIKF